jgi:hypothetical protein
MLSSYPNVHTLTLLISEEASGRCVHKEISNTESVFIVPVNNLNDDETFSNTLKGRLFNKIKINASLTIQQYKVLNMSLLPLFVQLGAD